MPHSSPIPISEFEPSVQGAAKSLFFPPQAYTSDDFHQFELAAVWRKDWIAVGRAEEIANVGDYFTVTIGAEPIIVIRDELNSIIAMSAVCRHRAMILAEGAGHCKGRFVCPYHSWTYDRRGQLIGAPSMPDGFDKTGIRLPRVRTELWQGIIFVNFDETAASLAPRLAPLDALVRDWRLADLRGESTIDPTYKMHFDYDWNWKVYAEGQSECYHCDKLHGDTPTMQGIDFASMTMVVDEPKKGVFAFSLRTKTIDHTLNHLGRAVFPAIETLSEEQRWLSYSIVIAPNIFMQLMSDCAILLCWFPAGAQAMRMKRHRLYPAATLARPDFAEKHAEEKPAIRYFVGQDDYAFERVQQGLRSAFAPRGPISAREPILSGFNQWLVERYRAADNP